MMKFYGWFIAVLILAAAGFFLFFRAPKVFEIKPADSVGSSSTNPMGGIQGQPEAPIPTSSILKSEVKKSSGDIENQQPLANPPAVIKAIYATGWSAGSTKKMDYLMKMIDETELNAIVIDIKDYSGYVSYYIDEPLIKGSGALNELRILKPNALIKKLHEKQIYVIGRISVFQDPILAGAHPEWALKSSSTGSVWKDNKGLAWMDPASKDVWNYDLTVARDALTRGFDEVNFDYVRFPSDGSLNKIIYPVWDKKSSRASVIGSFFKYLRENLGEAKLSADLFGLVTVAIDDLGIGQTLLKALPYFDYIDPMVYPSHYASGFAGYKNPADYPYEVIKNSLEGAMLKIRNYEFEKVKSTSTTAASGTTEVVKTKEARAKIRPWLQDFNLGATYDATKVRAEIKASEENEGQGWLVWNPANVYTREALLLAQ
ncbi:MAG: putative glycoside hydrolase [Candidatus Liptonbacteria bacterium]|nr:putative glycoside hydrolase [Candidatus Liptonbacteria bacterium]